MVSLAESTEQLAELIDPSAEFTQIGAGYRFTEGPAWNTPGNFLMFSDIPGDARWKWSAQGGMELVMWPTFKGNGMVYEPDGSLLVCEQVSSCVVRLRPGGEREVVAFHYRGKYLNSPNDVVTRTDGSIYFTDPNYGRWPVAVGVGRECELPFQGVYRVPPGGGDVELVVSEDEFEQPNGLCFSPDESILYINDRQNIKSFALRDDGSLSKIKIVHDNMGSVEIPGNGNPDGMKCDERGNLWCTARGGIWVVDPAGGLLGIIETPEVSGSLCWAGGGSHSLYVCTSTTMQVIETKVTSAPLPYH
jgi:gluconolactonase